MCAYFRLKIFASKFKYHFSVNNFAQFTENDNLLPDSTYTKDLIK